MVSDKQVVLPARCLIDFLIHEEIPDFNDYKVMVGRCSLFEGVEISIEQIEVDEKFDALNPNIVHDIGVITVSHKLLSLQGPPVHTLYYMN